MVYLDLDDLPRLIGEGGFISKNKYAAQSFQRSDHLFDTSRSLVDEVHDVIKRQTGQPPSGPIRLLTQLRYFGYYMSPLNLYYAFDKSDRCVETIVAEVNNTPWKERHCYVLWNENRRGRPGGLEFTHPKQFHVSPFMGMDLHYHWRLGEPGSDLTIHLANTRDSKQLFEADMKLRRQELSRAHLRRMVVRYPLMTAQVSAAIYLQALKLWWKKCPFTPIPKYSPSRHPLFRHR